jgi:hypothetical protein
VTRVAVGFIATLLAAGVLLSACGSESLASAMSKWVSQSQFHQNIPRVITDVHHTAKQLEDASSSAHVLHLVCGVLVTDTEEANASLPTPDAQSTKLLSRAYTDIGAGANICYGATSTAQRNLALARLRKGLSELTEGIQRVDVAQSDN